MSKELLVGFTAGKFDSQEELMDRIEDCKALGCTTMEVGFHLQETCELIGDINKLAESLEGLTVSFHGPSRTLYNNSEETKKDWDVLDKLVKRVKPHIVVIHSDLVRNSTFMDNFDWPFGIENSDWRKNFGRYASEMEEVLEKFPKASMVYDLNHVYTNDKTMELAKSFWPRFKDKIRHIHISGYVDENLYHYPLYKSDCDVVIKSLPTLDVPIILESGMSKLLKEDLPKELSYFLKRINV